MGRFTRRYRYPVSMFWVALLGAITIWMTTDVVAASADSSTLPRDAERSVVARETVCGCGTSSSPVRWRVLMPKPGPETQRGPTSQAVGISACRGWTGVLYLCKTKILRSNEDSFLTRQDEHLRL